MKDEKYWARRRKNNMAAKRSRDARRVKENQIALRAGFLEKEVFIYMYISVLLKLNTWSKLFCLVVIYVYTVHNCVSSVHDVK